MPDLSRMSTEALRRAWMRHRGQFKRWPDTFELAVADPVIASILEMYARREVPAFKRSGERGGVLRHPPTLTGKDRAAGERDE